jgi:hypothetical protein
LSLGIVLGAACAIFSFYFRKKADDFYNRYEPFIEEREKLFKVRFLRDVLSFLTRSEAFHILEELVEISKWKSHSDEDILTLFDSLGKRSNVVEREIRDLYKSAVRSKKLHRSLSKITRKLTMLSFYFLIYGMLIIFEGVALFFIPFNGMFFNNIYFSGLIGVFVVATMLLLIFFYSTIKDYNKFIGSVHGWKELLLNTKRLIEKLGYKPEVYGKIEGTSRIKQTFSIVITHNNKKVGVDFLSNNVLIGSVPVISFYLKTLDVADMAKTLLVVIPGLEDEAKKLAKSYNINLIECDNIENVPKELINKINEVFQN